MSIFRINLDGNKKA
ncbi:TPA: hypothetical protein ACGBQD_000100 [Escherichia coli]|nr:hypothetical protein [Escherichia coli]